MAGSAVEGNGEAAAGIEFGIYLPQVALSFGQVLDRALECERLGFDALWLYDHLYSPGQPDKPSLEAWTLATALLARTSRLRVGQLVLCNNFRHPALLAKMAATLDVISAGRLELGLGSGSVEEEHHQAGIAWGSARERSERLGEALEIVTRMFAGSVTTWQGQQEAGGFAGPPARVGDRIVELAEAGFSSFVFLTHDRASSETLELFAGEVMPRFRP